MHSPSKLRRTATLALGGLLSLSLLAGLFVAFGGLEDPPPPPGVGFDAGIEADPGSASVAQISGSMEGVGANGESTLTPVRRLGPDQVAVEDALLLTVVDASSGAPVPGATVYYADRRRLRSLPPGRRENRGFGWLSSVEQGAETVQTDGDGRASIPRSDERLFVVAKAEGLFGATTLRGGSTEAVLELSVDQTLFVRVVDDSGSARSGVEVALSVDRLSQLNLRSVEPSDDDGIAVFEHLQLYRFRQPQVDQALVAAGQEQRRQLAVLEQRIESTQQIGLEVEAVLRQQLDTTRRALREVGGRLRTEERERRRQRNAAGAAPAPPAYADFIVSTRSPQRDPIVRRIPALGEAERRVELPVGGLGAVEVRLIGPGGEPLWTPCTVELRRSEANPLPATIDAALVDGLQRVTRPSVDKPRGEGEVRFDSVGAGLLLDIAVRFRDNDFQFDVEGLQGPLEGELKVLDVQVPDWFSGLTGRLVNADGQPWRALEADLLIAGNRGRIEGERVTTDDEGRFELPFRLRDPADPYTLEIRAELEDQLVGTLVEVAKLSESGRTDLGDILVAPLPIFAEGTVRDDRGEPIPNARIELQEFLAAAGDGGQWRDVAFADTNTDEAGRYRLAAEPRDGQLRVRISARNHSRVDSPRLSFGEVFDATLQRIGSITVSGTLPEWLPRGAVEVVLSQDGRRLRDEDTRARGGGAFRTSFGNLMPGRYEIACVLKGIGPVAERFGIEVEPAGRVRIDDIDLSESVFRYIVRAVDQAGQPVRDPGSPLLAQVVGRNGRLDWVAFPWRGDRVEFYSSSRIADVVALGAGRLPVRQQLAPGESQLSFTQLQPIELQLPGLRSMLGERTVRISLVYDGDTGLPMEDLQAVVQGRSRGRGRGYPRAALGKSSGGWLRQNDVVRMPLMFNGRYRVVARVNEGRRRVSKDIGTVDAVVDGTKPQKVVVEPPAGVIQQILLELQAED